MRGRERTGTPRVDGGARDSRKGRHGGLARESVRLCQALRALVCGQEGGADEGRRGAAFRRDLRGGAGIRGHSTLREQARTHGSRTVQPAEPLLLAQATHRRVHHGRHRRRAA